MNLSKIFFGGFLIATLTVSLLTAASPQEPLAKYDGGFITEKDLAFKQRLKIFQLKTEVAKVKRKAIRQKIIDRLYEKEAKLKNTTVTIYLRDFIDKNIAKVTEKEIANTAKQYQKNGGDKKAEFKKQIEEYLLSKHRQEALDKLDDILIAKYHVEIFVPLPKSLDFSIPIKDAPFWGKSGAKVVVVEYSDYQCPYCKKMQPAIKRLRKEYSNKIQWVFKSFPLPFHKKAMPAHVAALCAKKQDKYFDYHFKVFERSPEIDGAALKQIAKQVNLDYQAFDVCLKDKDNKLSSKIQQDIEEGGIFGVSGTPTIFINNSPVTGYLDYQQLKVKIDNALLR